MSSENVSSEKKSWPENIVLAKTSNGFIRFSTLQEALDSPLVEPHDVIYTGFQDFHQATGIKRLESICTELGQKIPDDAYKGNPEGTRTVWNLILEASKAPEDVKKVPTGRTSAKNSTVSTTTKSSSSSTGAKTKYPDNWVITVNAQENPKRADAARRFALYKTGMTVGEYIAAGGLRTDINWDSNPKNGWISVNPPPAE